MISKPCEWCKAPFEYIPKKRVRFCCWPCRDASFAANGPHPTGSDHPNWKGGVLYNHGHRLIKTGDKYEREHRIMVEAAIGIKLPSSVPIHHVNLQRDDNRNSNFVVCQDAAYHMLLHYRQRMIERGANPNTEGICCACGKKKLLTEFKKDNRRQSGRDSLCKACHSGRQCVRQAKEKELR